MGRKAKKKQILVFLLAKFSEFSGGGQNGWV
jgi:hypothetical protein